MGGNSVHLLITKSYFENRVLIRVIEYLEKNHSIEIKKTSKQKYRRVN